MKFYRVKTGFTNSSGFLRIGQVFLVADVQDLPKVHGMDWSHTKPYYQEVQVNGPFGTVEVANHLKLVDLK